MEITSKPEELEKSTAKSYRWMGGCRKRKQPRFQRTVGTTGKELADLKVEQRALNAQWQSEKDIIPRFRQKKRSTG